MVLELPQVLEFGTQKFKYWNTLKIRHILTWSLKNSPWIEENKMKNYFRRHITHVLFTQCFHCCRWDWSWCQSHSSIYEFAQFSCKGWTVVEKTFSFLKIKTSAWKNTWKSLNLTCPCLQEPWWNKIRPNSACHLCFFALIHFSVRQEGETPQGSCVAGGLPCFTQRLRDLWQMPMPNLHSQQGCIPARHPLFLHLCMWPLDQICGPLCRTVNFTHIHTSSLQKIKRSVMNRGDKTDDWMSGKWKMSGKCRAVFPCHSPV